MPAARNPISPESKPSAPDAKEGVLYIGIDLGTSRTAVAASNGVRESCGSLVGYPKDVVSRKALKKDVLFGEEALRNRLSLNFFRPLAMGVIQHSEDDPASPAAMEFMRAASDLVRHAVSLAKARTDELVYAVIGCPAECSIKNKKAILDAARSVVDCAMICSEPFSVAYGMDILKDALVIDIGAGTTDLCRMHGTLPAPEDQTTNRCAGDSVDEQLKKLLKESCPGAQLTIHRVTEIKEKFSYVGEQTDPVWVDLPVNGKPTPFEVSRQVREACRSIIPPMLEDMQKLIGSFDPDFQSILKRNVLLGGGGSQIRGLGSAIEKAMIDLFGEGRVTSVPEPVYAGANGSLKIAHDMPAEFWEKLR